MHRMILRPESQLRKVTADEVLAEVLAAVRPDAGEGENPDLMTPARKVTEGSHGRLARPCPQQQGRASLPWHPRGA